MTNSEINILFLGGDKRQEHIYGLIKNEYPNSRKAGISDSRLTTEVIQNAQIIVFPTIVTTDNFTINAPEYSETILIDDVISGAISAKAIIGGKMPISVAKKIESNNIKCYQYVESTPFKILNAIPTAEAAISIAVCNRNRTLWGSKCLIIGNGCIGKTLSRLLQCYGAQITVAARKDEDFAEIRKNGYKVIKTKDINETLWQFDLIFNTVPFRVITNDAVSKLNEETLFIELASKPYGFDSNYIDECKCKMIIASSLPGKYSPVTAAEIAATTIEQIISEVIINE